MTKSPIGTRGLTRSRFVQTQRLHRFSHFEQQLRKAHFVSLLSRSDQQISTPPTHIQRRKYAPATNLPKASLKPIPLYDLASVFGNDDPKPGTRSGGRREEDIEIPSPLSLPPLQQGFDFSAVPNSYTARQVFPALRRKIDYLLPIVTTSCARPCRLRRFSVARPPLVFIRARNPCLLIRLRFRGLYVGIMASSPIHRFRAFENEPKKIVSGVRGRQMRYCVKPAKHRALTGLG
jgi:hypothetical protein